jgi:AraC-like DNA-binding protein
MIDKSIWLKALEQLILLFDREWSRVSIDYFGLWRNQGWDGPAGSLEIAYYVQGRNLIVQDGHPLDVREGHLLFLPDTIRHSRSEGGQFKAYYLSFSLPGHKDASAAVQELYASLEGPLFIPGLESCFSKLLSIFQPQRSGAAFTKHFFLNILVQAYEIMDRLTDSRIPLARDGHKDLVDAVIGELNEEYQSRIRLADLAGKYGMNERYMNHVFKTITGVPLGRYLTRIRIEHAKRLLLTTPLTVTDIALDTGFYDASHFCKTFKSLEQISPVEYKNSRKSGR